MPPKATAAAAGKADQGAAKEETTKDEPKRTRAPAYERAAKLVAGLSLEDMTRFAEEVAAKHTRTASHIAGELTDAVASMTPAKPEYDGGAGGAEGLG